MDCQRQTRAASRSLLNALLIECSSTGDLFAPGVLRIESGCSRNTNAAYAASETITSLCFKREIHGVPENPVVALAPVGLFGLIQHNDLRALQHVLRNRIEVRQEMVLLRQLQVEHLAAIPFRVRAENR